jgi:nucleotide-binding universal stress UspA family protein
MFEHILIPTDGSVLSEEAVEKALAFAGEAGARATLLAVVEPMSVFAGDAAELGDLTAEYAKQASARAREVLARGEERARAVGVAVTTVTEDDDQPFRAIVRAAETHGCDLIAMASHGRRGLAALMIGSQTAKVLANSKVPVLVYR